MIACDRCNKLAAHQINIIPSKGTDLCDRCNNDLNEILSAFLVAKSFSVAEPKVGSVIDPSDPIESNVK